MAEKIDLELSEAVIDEAAQASIDTTVAQHPEFIAWSRRVREFSELCRLKKLKSYIPVLGNALLAKGSNPRIDVFSLKAKDKSQGAYDARRTAEKVLVPASYIYKFSLGTTGAQPLNNQPFFRSFRIDRDLPVRGDAADVRDALLSLLHEIQQYRRDEAVRGLAAFIAVRREFMPRYALTQGTLTIGSGRQLSTIVKAFVGPKSDGGGRAQAVAGGLMDALYTVERVRVGKKNEPDRKMPGDVGIRATTDSASPFTRILEVRDKNVPAHAVMSFVAKVAAAGIGRAILVAVDAHQEVLDVAELQTQAQRTGTDLEIYTDWQTLIRAVTFASEAREVAFVESAVSAIRARIIMLELPVETITEWDSVTLRVNN
jgi:SacI restriction endonuclease